MEFPGKRKDPAICPPRGTRVSSILTSPSRLRLGRPGARIFFGRWKTIRPVATYHSPGEASAPAARVRDGAANDDAGYTESRVQRGGAACRRGAAASMGGWEVLDAPIGSAKLLETSSLEGSPRPIEGVSGGRPIHGDEDACHVRLPTGRAGRIPSTEAAQESDPGLGQYALFVAVRSRDARARAFPRAAPGQAGSRLGVILDAIS